MRKSRGVALITTMLVMLVILLFLGAMLALNPSSLARATSSIDQGRAEQAALAGLDYAKTRLQESPEWKGDLNRVIINSPTLFIQEDQGNVIGLLRQNEGEPFSMFRIRFNFQNGAASSDPLDDGLDDPSSDFFVPSSLVSVNNMASGSRFVPRANSSFVVTDFTTGPYEAPNGSAVICVEGLAGSGLSECAPGNFETSRTGSSTVVRQVEAVLQTALADPAEDAALMGGEQVIFNLASAGKEVEIKAKGETARIRSKGDVTVNDGDTSENYKSDGEVSLPSASTFTANTSGVTRSTEAAADPFYTLDWADVHRADPDPGTDEAVHLPGGTYVWWDDDSLHYYDMDLSSYQSFIALDPANPGVSIASEDFSEIRTPTNLSNNSNGVKVKNGKLEIKKDVRVTPTANTSDFTLIPRRGTKSNSTDTSADTNVVGVPADNHGADYEIAFKNSPTISVDGDLLMAGEIAGDDGASLVADGDLRLDAAKLEKYSSVGISMYASGDLDISTYHPESSDYGKVKVEGMFYSWGDLTVQAGEAGVAHADVEVKGALVAYGSDVEPSTSLPGSSGGVLEVSGDKVKVEWDATKLGDLLDVARIAALTDMEIVSYIRHR
jgi:hypothetical protein